MGFKVNLFVLLVGIFAISRNNGPSMLFLICSSGAILLHQNWKIWQFIGKFPGGKSYPDARKFLENSSKCFREEINRLWRTYGCDKFVTWIGFERFVTVSRLGDVKAVLTASNEEALVENFRALWPWMGGDCLKSSDFTSQILAEVITSDSFNDFVNSQKFNEELRRKISTFYQQNLKNNESVDIEKLARFWMFDVICGIATGTNVGYKKKELFEEAEKLLSIADQRLYSGLQQLSLYRTISGSSRKFNKSQQNFHETISKLIAGNAEKSTVSSLHDFLAQNFPNIDAAAFIATFIILGYDRLSTAFSSIVGQMAKKGAKVDIEGALKSQAVVPVTQKYITSGISLNGFFIPPNTNVLIFLSSGTDTNAKLFENSKVGDFISMKILKAFVETFGEKFQCRAEKVETNVGYGVTLREKSGKIFIKSK